MPNCIHVFSKEMCLAKCRLKCEKWFSGNSHNFRVTSVVINLNNNHENNANRERMLQPRNVLAIILAMAIKNTRFGLARPVFIK